MILVMNACPSIDELKRFHAQVRLVKIRGDIAAPT